MVNVTSVFLLSLLLLAVLVSSSSIDELLFTSGDEHNVRARFYNNETEARTSEGASPAENKADPGGQYSLQKERREPGPKKPKNEPNLESINQGEGSVTAQDLHIQLPFRATCLSTRSNRVDCYGVDYSNKLVHLQIDNGVYHDPEGFITGYDYVSEPKCVSVSEQNIYCFVQESYQLLAWEFDISENIHKSYAHDIKQICGNPGGPEDCIVKQSGEIWCIIPGSDNIAEFIIFAPGVGWKEPVTIGRPLFHMSCATYSGEYVDCMGSGRAMLLQHDRASMPEEFNSPDWDVLWGVYTYQKPTLVYIDANNLMALVHTYVQRMIAYATFDGTSWGNWRFDLAGSVSTEPECIMSENVLHCFVLGTDGKVMLATFKENKWSRWEAINLDESFLDKPSCVKFSENEIRCYSRNVERKLQEIIYEIN